MSKVSLAGQSSRIWPRWLYFSLCVVLILTYFAGFSIKKNRYYFFWMWSTNPISLLSTVLEPPYFSGYRKNTKIRKKVAVQLRCTESSSNVHRCWYTNNYILMYQLVVRRRGTVLCLYRDWARASERADVRGCDASQYSQCSSPLSHNTIFADHQLSITYCFIDIM